MTRSDPAGEPSMEDILASIRRIIAEEPPGSRAGPEPAPSQPAPASRLAPSSPSPRSEFAPAPQQFAPEPYLKSSRADAAPSFPAASIPEFEAPQAYERPAPVATSSGPLSVDDQLSDLLGEGPAPIAAAPSFEPPPAFGTPPDFISRLTGRSAPSRPSEPAPSGFPELQPRPGFTVSRAGYVPDTASETPARDTFELSLGPSPFANKRDERQSGAQAEKPVESTSNRTSLDFGSLIPSRHFEPAPFDGAPDEGADAPAPSNDFRLSVSARREPVQEPPSTASSAPVNHSEASVVPDDPVSQARPAKAELHRGAAQALGTYASVFRASSLPVSDQREKPAGLAVATAAPSKLVQPDVPTPADIAKPVAALAQNEGAGETEQRAATAAEEQGVVGAEQVSSAALTLPDDSIMEDKVADLLRPMLKTWLAENMPKIVERALRKEIAESNLVEHKPAAE